MSQLDPERPVSERPEPTCPSCGAPEPRWRVLMGGGMACDVCDEIIPLEIEKAAYEPVSERPEPMGASDDDRNLPHPATEEEVEQTRRALTAIVAEGGEIGCTLEVALSALDLIAEIDRLRTRLVEAEKVVAERDRLLAALWRIKMTCQRASVNEPVWQLPNSVIHLAEGAMARNREKARALAAYDKARDQ